MELDRHAFAIRGARAAINWGYRPAAALVDWSFAGTAAAGGQVTAKVVSRDAFRLSQAPLTLVLHLVGHVDGPGTVKWPVRGIADQEGAVLITVGPCERTSHGTVQSGAAGYGPAADQ